jgi:hypothetical protein
MASSALYSFFVSSLSYLAGASETGVSILHLGVAFMRIWDMSAYLPYKQTDK